ncbi:transposase [Streptomyces sp. NBC_01614]|uniref:transposase n=1 Tax=Streptomyces sp. NBC_01614 TaxID=2975897 RepID=UPI00386BCD55
MTVFRLPAYAPDLNPTEGVWANLKNDLGNQQSWQMTCADVRQKDFPIALDALFFFGSSAQNPFKAYIRANISASLPAIISLPNLL